MKLVQKKVKIQILEVSEAQIQKGTNVHNLCVHLPAKHFFQFLFSYNFKRVQFFRLLSDSPPSDKMTNWEQLIMRLLLIFAQKSA